MSTRDTKSENVRAPPRRKKRTKGGGGGADQTQDEVTVVSNHEEEASKHQKVVAKRKVNIKPKKRTTESKENSKENQAPPNVPRQPSLPPNVEHAFADFVKTTLEKGVDGLRKEFAELKTYTALEFKYDHFNANVTTGKNRYRDVVCLDATRVVLNLNVPPEGDYIHANWVKMEGLERSYIATQGPLELTAGDFWRLVFQENATSVLMLCRVLEDNKPKCFQYFPQEQGSYKNYGCMFVNNKKVEQNDDKVTTYTLEILPDGCSNSNIVKLIHFDQWPDRGVPEKPMPILRTMRLVPNGVCVLHCSAGIGRTGSVIAIDTAIHRLVKGIPVVMRDLFKQLRDQRASAIQTEAQYVFVHTCIFEYIRAKLPGKYREIAFQFAEEVKKANMV
uniref:Protein-tyrosine phosphatase n=1 Tax=Panagrolaimus sp. JU765 TaxID=591449 RepID=A0AC34QTU4_9BILA